MNHRRPWAAGAAGRAAHFLIAMTFCVSVVYSQESRVSRGAWFEPNDKTDDGCTVQFLKTDYKETESRYPCGQWFAPEPGNHIVWLEGKHRISPMWTVVMVPAPPAKNELRMRMPMVDAATISVDPRDFPEKGTVRMVSLSQDNVAFERRIVSREQATNGVLMPAGKQFVATFGPDGRAIALAPIANLKVGDRYRFASAALGEHGAILALLDQPPEGRSVRDATVTLRSSGVSIAPDALKIAQRRIYAVWYSVTPGDYNIDVAGLALENKRALVERGLVTTVRAELKRNSQTEKERR